MNASQEIPREVIISKEVNPVRLLKISRDGERIIVDASLVLDLYDDYLESLDVGLKTKRNYPHQIKPFFTWWREYGELRDWRLERDCLTLFARWLKREYRTKRGFHPKQNSRRTTCMRVKQYLKWFYTTGRVPVDVSSWVVVEEEEYIEPRPLSASEIERMFVAARGANRVRDITLLSFLIETAARIEEAANVTYEDTTFDACFSGAARLRITKGDKPRTVVFGPTTGKLIKLLSVYLGVREGSIFGLTSSGISHVVNSLSERSGVQCTAHDMRDTFATYWLEHCQASNPDMADALRKVQMGHSLSGVTYRHYTRLTHEKVKEYWVSPLDDLDLLGL